MSANRRKIRRGRKILRKPDNIQVGKSINRHFSPASLISIPNDAKFSNILIQNDAQFSNEISNEIEAHTVAAPVEEETEQFIPTVTPFASSSASSSSFALLSFKFTTRCEPLRQQRHGHPPAEPLRNPSMTSKTSSTLRTTSLSPPPPSPPLSSRAPQLLEAGHQVRHLTLMAPESR